MGNPKKPFKVICTNCNREVEKKDTNGKINFNVEPIEVYGRPFYDTATTHFECDCGNEIEI